MKKPYIEKIDDRGKLSIWIVDGIFIRGHIDEEFTNCGQHFRYHYIPLSELWLDQEANPDERPFFIEHLLVEHRLMVHGMAYADALEKADAFQRRMRRRTQDVDRVTHHGDRLPPLDVAHKELWKTLENGVTVWIVDGRMVRSVFDIDFTAGGHDHVYEFVPENEVWIDDDILDIERPYVILHELHERNLMVSGMPYLKAHDSASKLEYHCRHLPDELHFALEKEGWA